MKTQTLSEEPEMAAYKSGDRLFLNREVYSHTAKKTYPADTPVMVTKAGQHGGNGSFQVVTDDAQLIVVKGYCLSRFASTESVTG